jgi:hypothetical protein
MATPTSPPFYVPIARKAEKLVLDLSVAHNKTPIAQDATAIHVLDKGTGNFTLTFHFADGTEFTLNQNEVNNGDSYYWSITKLYLTNEAQSGLSATLLIEYHALPQT